MLKNTLKSSSLISPRNYIGRLKVCAAIIVINRIANIMIINSENSLHIIFIL